MIYIWLVLLTIAVMYLFYTVGVIMDAVETIQDITLEKLEKISADLAVNERKIEDINNQFKESE